MLAVRSNFVCKRIKVKGSIMILQNLHTHCTYCDGKDTIEEY